MRINMTVTGTASLHWLPQETILFDGAGFVRQLDVQMVEDSSFLASEMMVFGRTAMQETVRQGSVRDQWRIWCDGKLIHAEAFRLDGQIVKTDVIKEYPPDPTSMIFWLKNRQPEKWRDRVEYEKEVPDDRNITINLVDAKKPE